MSRPPEGRIDSSRQTKSTQDPCGKSSMTYPHWPPSCHEEAVAQLHCILGKDINHRGYLAHSWYCWLIARTYSDTPVSVGNQAFCAQAASLVADLCPKLSDLRVEPDPIAVKRSRYCGPEFCERQCFPTIAKGQPFCLCVSSSSRGMSSTFWSPTFNESHSLQV